MSEKSPKFAVVLSGCGNFDGSEIHEATLGLLAIDEQGGQYQCFAPDIEQGRTIDAYRKQVVAVKGEAGNRRVLQESARIARGNILPLSELDVNEFDAVVFVGGQGAINNWSNYASHGADFEVDSEITRVLEQAYAGRKWIGAMCIAPVVVAKVLGRHGIHVTIGDDSKVAAEIESFGAVHENRTAAQACVDEKHSVVTTPCYMLAKSIKEIYQGNSALVKAIVEDCK